jgi:hypothetical protein
MTLNKIIGQQISSDKILIDKDLVLNIKTGQIEPLTIPTVLNGGNSVVVNQVEENVGIDEVKIDLKLTNGNREVDSRNGYLIEIFLSGTDGKLTRLYQDELIDPISGDVLRESFSEFLVLKVDVT